MPRPCKRRRICAEPSCDHFGPKGAGSRSRQVITMTVDEFECIRLIDLKGKTQEQCAAQMNVSRTTAQAIYGSARCKLAECLVNGKELKIEGGDYVLCDGDAPETECGHTCWRYYQFMPQSHTTAAKKLNLEEMNMKIAVTYENGQIFQHFGHCENFKVYEIENNEIKSAAVESAVGSGHGALAGFLQSLGVNALICSGIGGGARIALGEAGIELYPGAFGDADEAVDALLKGSLTYDPNTVCSHHHHEDGHDCGHEGHACGEDKHGCGGN